MPISKEDVQHIAKLARLHLTEDETERYSKQLGDIIDYFEMLNTLDLKDVEPLSSVLDNVNVNRRDEAVPGLARERVLANAPQVQDEYFTVPRVIGEDED